MGDLPPPVQHEPTLTSSAFSPTLQVPGEVVPAMSPPLATGRARPARVALRRLSADVAQSLTLLSHRGIDCLIDMKAGATPRGWRLSLSTGVAQPLRDACDREAVIDWSGARMRLLYRNAATLSWLAARLNIDGDMPLDDASARSLRGAALDDLIGRLALTGLGMPHIVHDRALSASARGTASGAFSFVVLLQALDAAKPTILAALEADAFGVNVLAALLQNRPERPRGSARDATLPHVHTTAGEDMVPPCPVHVSMPIVVRAILPPAYLTLAELRALAVGDIVLLGVPWTARPHTSGEGHAPSAAPGGQHGLRAVGVEAIDDAAMPVFIEIAGRVYWRVVAKGGTGAAADGWCVRLINRERGVVDDGMNDTNGGGSRMDGSPVSGNLDGRDGASWTDHVAVRVSFELGGKTVPLAELRQWREGGILTFQPSFVPQANATASAGRAARRDEDDEADLDIDDDIEAALERHDTHEMGESADSIAPDAPPLVRVRIRVNGAPVGVGELVEIDGQLGVSIMTLFADGAYSRTHPEEEKADETGGVEADGSR